MPWNLRREKIYGQLWPAGGATGRRKPKGGGATVSKNKNPRPAGGTAEQGNHGKSDETVSSSNFTSGGAGRQGRIFSLLLEGEENALPAANLAQLAGYKNQRSMRLAVDREREQGLLVLASESGYYRPAAGDRGIAEIRRFLRRQDARAASNRRTTRRIREYLRAAEKAPLDGQETIWGGDDT